MSKETLEEFFARVMRGNRVTALRWELRHRGADARSDGPVIASSDFEPSTAPAAAEEITSLVLADAAERHGVQVYTVVILEKSKLSSLGQYQVRQEGSTDDRLDDHSGTSTEPANAAGLVAQAKRHTEVAWKMNAQMVDTVLRRADREIERLKGRCEYYEDEYRKMLELYSKLVMGDREHEADIADRKRKHELQDRVAGRLLPVVTAILTKVTGQSGTSTDPLLLAMEDGMSDWTMDDIMEMAGALKEDGKRVAFLEMVKALEERKRARKTTEEEKPQAAAE